MGSVTVPKARLVLFCRFGIALNSQILEVLTLMSADIGLLNDASPSRIGGLPDAVLPLRHRFCQCITTAQFTPTSAIDARMKNELPSGVYLPFSLIVILRRLNDILCFCLFHYRCALKIMSSTSRITQRVFNSARWMYCEGRKLSAVRLLAYFSLSSCPHRFNTKAPSMVFTVKVHLILLCCERVPYSCDADSDATVPGELPVVYY